MESVEVELEHFLRVLQEADEGAEQPPQSLVEGAVISRVTDLTGGAGVG